MTRTIWRWLAAGTLTVALAGCGHDATPDVNVHWGGLNLRDGLVAIRGADGTEATVSADGQLAISGRAVAVSDAERTELARYFSSASAVVAHAKATGAAGAQVGVTAANAVVSGIMKGDMSELKSKVETQAGEVKRQALALCGDVGALRAAQEAVQAEVPAFRLYAIVAERDALDCARDLHSASTP